jgi:protein-L-isoaspartate(D-aspartate) O-methyltransferase
MARFSKTVLLIAAGIGLSTACAQKDQETERQAMVETLRIDSQRAEENGAPSLGERTLSVLGQVPRHEFVPDDQKSFAYQNRPLPIGAGQTISQPYIVALMTDLAQVTKDDVVLEVGTGSGYQAAVLAELGAEVWSIEALPELAEEATERLERLGYDSVHCRQGDGAWGWPEAAPFDAVVVTAAATSIPPALVDQLKRGGRLIIPLGPPDGVLRHTASQRLLRIDKATDGGLSETVVLPVAFVPLVTPPKASPRSGKD